MAENRLELVGEDKPVGGTGVKLVGKALYNWEDTNPDFHGSKGTAIYSEMENDPDVASAMFRFTAPIQSAEWTIEPWDESAEAEDWAEFCKQQVMCDGTYWQVVGDTWATRLEHIVLMLTYGFSAFEIVWGRDSRGRNVFAKMLPMLHASVTKFNVGERWDLESVETQAYTPGEGLRIRTIQAFVGGTRKVSVFTFRGRGFNYWGRPIIRSAYKPYYHKHGIEKIDGMAIERNGFGFMHMNLPSDATPEQIAQAEKVVYETRAHHRGGTVSQGDVKVEFLYPTGNDPKRVEAMQFRAQQIYSAMMSEWATLGATQSGSRAVSQSKMDYALMAYQGTTNLIADTANRQWIVPLMDRNEGSGRYPKIKVQDLSEMSGDKLATLLPPLVEKKLLTAGPNTEDYLRQILDLPEEDRPEWMDAAPVPVKPFGEGTEPDSEGGEGRGPGPSREAGPEGAEPKAAVSKSDLVVPSRLRRALLPHELHMDAEAMAEYLEKEPVRIWHRVVKPIRDKQIAAIAKYAATLPVSVLARGVYGRGDAWPHEKEMAQELGAALLGVYREGRKAVRAELSRQRVRKQDEEEDEAAASDVTWIKRLATGYAAISVFSLLSEAVRAGLNAHQLDLPAPEVEARIRQALTELSEPRQQADVAGRVSQSFANGRNDQLEALGEEFSTFYYSAVMDQGTCEPCGALDGTEHALSDTTYATPNPNCEGGIDRCRCITIGIAREEAA